MKKILIIDDEPHILLMLKKMLERYNYEIDMATNGAEGIELYKLYKPDLVITDIIMPEKEGLETIREMKRLNSDLKIIAMSGGGKVSAESYLKIAGIFGASKSIAKPFSMKEMLVAIQELLMDGSEGKDSAKTEQGESGLEKENSC
jgi:DNA-binding response OmpR family regulator